MIVSYALEQIAALASKALAMAASEGETLEIVELREQISKLQQLDDPDLAAAIEAKQQRLESLMQQPGYELELLEKIADPRWCDLATYEEVRQMLQRLVLEIEITRQAPTAIRLRL